MPSRLVCIHGPAEQAYAAARDLLRRESFALLGCFWPRGLQRSLDAAVRARSLEPLAQAPAEFRSYLEPARELLDELFASGRPPRFVCLDFNPALPSALLNQQRARRLHTAVLPGERALVIAVGRRPGEGAAFAELLRAKTIVPAAATPEPAVDFE